MDIKHIVSQLTLEEKASLCSGADDWHTEKIDRLGIPNIMMSDGPHGLRKVVDVDENEIWKGATVKATCYPSGAGLASSWNRELIYGVGKALGKEAKGEKLSILLGPAINIKRSPVCGRNFEYYSEDPFLAGKLAASFINGVQSEGVGTSLKHFAVNNHEYRRHSTNPIVDMRTLREIYLTAFEIAVKESNPATIMHSYNRINGCQVSKSKWLLDGVLRDEWGYEGIVISDWGGMNDRVASLDAGCDIEMPSSGGVRDDMIVKAVKEGRLDERILDKTVERILKTVYKYLPENNAPKADLEKNCGYAAFVAEETMVLLKNEKNLLPLDGERPLAVIGEFGSNIRFQGRGSSRVNAAYVEHPLKYIKRFNKAEVCYAPGYELSGDVNTPNEALINEAVACAKKCGRALVFIGLPDEFESESYDRADMRLPDSHNELVRRIAEEVPDTVVVLTCGSPVEMPWLDRVSTLFLTYLGGSGAGLALAGLLYGAVSPSGKLAETFPVKIEDNPAYLNYPGIYDDVVYAEGVFVGYRYYQKKKMKVNFPFGFGLSYTKFSYDEIVADGDRVKVKVTNVGKIAGKEVVQLYVCPPKSAVVRPDRELKGFTKIFLAPGESKWVEFTLDDRSFAYYDVRVNDWRVETGDYTVFVGGSSVDTPLSVVIKKQDKNPYVPEITDNTPLIDIINNPGYDGIRDEFLLGFFKPEMRIEAEKKGIHVSNQTVFPRKYQTPRMYVRGGKDTVTEDDIAESVKQFNNKLKNK
ncbi:MAG: glycoside hydrolase family 3 C-terminal domain-containing protein [Clostridia bacterium]|nr:glycoside hydrolase family 3 C-terminal domain-containing protein [Clostridia bacterium]